MIPLIIGTDQQTQRPIEIPHDCFSTHFHLLGGTGAGKTSAIRTMLYSLLLEPRNQCALFLVDPVGNLSQDLLLWMADEELCPNDVRDRLVYIQPACSDYVMPFNPLTHQSADHLYFQVGRAVEIVLRAWSSQNIEEMPRLRQWCFNSFFAVAAMGLPLAAVQYLLQPGSEEHNAILLRLPERLKLMWSEILTAKGHERVRILESTRNRLAPFFDSGILRRMFGSIHSRFDVRRFIRERRIVLINVAQYGLLDRHIGNTIGGLAVNEILQTAMTMSRQEVNPTYLLLDEFQHFVSEDLYEALPLVRQLGLRLILSHQSLSQLERGDIDLNGIIWQARSRLVFANDAEDANRLAEEFGYLTFDPYQLKEHLQTYRQRIAGYRREWLRTRGHTSTDTHATDIQHGQASAENVGEVRPPQASAPTHSQGTTKSQTHGHSDKTGHSEGTSEGEGESLVPIHEEFYETASKTYFSFDEQRIQWGQRIRLLRTGEALGKFRDDPNIYDLKIRFYPVRDTPELRARAEELVQRNFESELFVSAACIEQEAEELRRRILTGPPIPMETQATCLDAPLQEETNSPKPSADKPEDNWFR